MKFAMYAVASTAVAAGTISYAIQSKQQFYSTVCEHVDACAFVRRMCLGRVCLCVCVEVYGKLSMSMCVPIRQVHVCVRA